ncbi:Bromodomain associated domain-containing protein [Plasmodiophora brassicae]
MEYVVYDDDGGGDDDDDAGTPSYTFVDASSARRAFNLALLRVLDAWQMTLHSVWIALAVRVGGAGDDLRRVRLEIARYQFGDADALSATLGALIQGWCASVQRSRPADAPWFSSTGASELGRLQRTLASIPACPDPAPPEPIVHEPGPAAAEWRRPAPRSRAVVSLEDMVTPSMPIGGSVSGKQDSRPTVPALLQPRRHARATAYVRSGRWPGVRSSSNSARIFLGRCRLQAALDYVDGGHDPAQALSYACQTAYPDEPWSFDAPVDDDARLQDDTARAILGKAVAIEIGVAGFSSSSSHAADVLTDLVASFLQDVARQANQSGHCTLTPDLAMATLARVTGAGERQLGAHLRDEIVGGEQRMRDLLDKIRSSPMDIVLTAQEASDSNKRPRIE